MTHTELCYTCMCPHVLAYVKLCFNRLKCFCAFRCNRSHSVHCLSTLSLRRPLEVHGVTTTTVKDTHKPQLDFGGASIWFCWHSNFANCLLASHVWTLYLSSKNRKTNHLTWSSLFPLHVLLFYCMYSFVFPFPESTARWEWEYKNRGRLCDDWLPGWEYLVQRVVLDLIGAD